VNVNGTASVIHACQRAGVSHLIYTSSMDVVFSGTPVCEGTEELATQPHSRYNGYVRTKARAEQLVLQANEANLTTCSLRPAHIYGPEDEMIVTIVRERVNDRLPAVFSAGRQAYVYVENCVSAHVDCVERLLAGHTDQSAFFLICVAQMFKRSDACSFGSQSCV
ncbi:uncharacterized protein MONBRDRAFT_13872, partial [Monosiga brevicollis MX1]